VGVEAYPVGRPFFTTTAPRHDANERHGLGIPPGRDRAHLVLLSVSEISRLAAGSPSLNSCVAPSRRGGLLLFPSSRARLQTCFTAFPADLPTPN
jgi:hypothetical protein